MRPIANSTPAIIRTVALLSLACREPIPPEPGALTAPDVSLAANVKDNRPPTAPTNLRAASVTAYTVALAWNPSSDNSGVFSYRVRNNVGYEFTVPQSQTSFQWTYGLAAQTTYTFSVYAVDASGNTSKTATTTATTTRDVNPPSAPAFAVGDVGPTHISLAWSSTDDGPSIGYSIAVNGTPDPGGITSATSRTFEQLAPATTYTFTVTARDNAMNFSPPSQVTVTTRSADFTDTEPPTAPSNVRADGFGDGSTELLVTWTASSDNVDPQSRIRYEVFINGNLSEVTVGTTRATTYGVNGTNTIQVFAIDAARNRSAAGTITAVIQL